MELLFMDPVFKHNIWGGSNLRRDYGYMEEGDDIGECWGIAAHPKGDCSIREGEFQGKTLSWLWENRPQLFGKSEEETNHTVFPLLIKIIDAKDDLSIQVHPNDDYAKVNEDNSLGKTECWYILHCKEDATLVIGHNAKDKKELEKMIHQGRWKELIREIPVKKGDFIQIDPGTIHAIKGGITLLETQQNSDITYRLYDYDRLWNGQLRPLHIKKSIDVITVPAESTEKAIVETANMEENQLNLLYRCPYYQVFNLKVYQNMSFTKSVPYLLMSVVEGLGSVNGYEVKKGDHFIVPFGVDKVSCSGAMELMVSSEAPVLEHGDRQ